MQDKRCGNFTFPPDGEPSPELSVVVPIFNEAANLDAFFAQLTPVLNRLGLEAEILCVDDGSADGSWAFLVERQRYDPRLRLLRLSRNFGKDAALACGLAHSAGKAVVLIDADLQHPPEVIEEFVAKWREGYDMVYGLRRSRTADRPLRRLAGHAFDRLFQRLADIPIPTGAGDFRLLDRRVVDIVNQMPERVRYMKGLFAWTGFRHAGVDYDAASRQAGQTTWSFLRLFSFAFNGITSFSTKPFVVITYVGVLLAVPSFLMGVYYTIRMLVAGYAPEVIAVLLLGSIQLLTLGLFGVYLARIFEEVKCRPLYLVYEHRGFEARAGRNFGLPAGGSGGHRSREATRA